MRSFSTTIAAALLVAGVIVGPPASTAEPVEKHRPSMGHPRPDADPGGRAIQGSTPQNAGGHNNDSFVPGATLAGYPVRRHYVPYPYGDGYYPRYSHSPYYHYPYGYYRGYLYPPPVYVPAERLYGPQAMRRFMGVGP